MSKIHEGFTKAHFVDWGGELIEKFMNAAQGLSVEAQRKKATVCAEVIADTIAEEIASAGRDMDELLLESAREVVNAGPPAVLGMSEEGAAVVREVYEQCKERVARGANGMTSA